MPGLAAGGSPDAGSARLQGSFVMKGKVTRADGVRGEHEGQHVKRTWSFNSKCNGGACANVVLHKRRGGGHTDKLVLHRTSPGVYFASKLSAKYENPKRINHTECQGQSLGRDGARYTGTAKDLPGPPRARFRRTSTTGTTLKFQDRSKRGAGNAPLRSRKWDFGDPLSGPANSSTEERPSHTFTAPGTYTVKLTVTDRNGLTGTVTHQYTVQV